MIANEEDPAYLRVTNSLHGIPREMTRDERIMSRRLTVRMQRQGTASSRDSVLHELNVIGSIASVAHAREMTSVSRPLGSG